MLLQALRKLSGKLFAEFTENKFLEIFKSSCNPTGNVFVQDDDPSQNSNAPKTALAKIGAVQFSIPPRSPDFNPVENAFNSVKKNSVVMQTNISFPKRVMQSLWKELKRHF